MQVARVDSSLFAQLRLRQVGIFRSLHLQRNRVRRNYESLDLAQDKEVNSCHRSTVFDLDLDLPESKFLLAAAAFGEIGLYNLCGEDVNGLCGAQAGYTVDPLATYHRRGDGGFMPTITTVQWFPFDSGMFFSGSVDGSVTLWHPETAESVFSWDMDGQNVNDLHLSPVAAHCLVAACSGKSVRLCDLRTQSSTHQLFGHGDLLMAARWSPSDEFLIASGARDQTIRLWDIRRPGPLRLLDQDNNSPAIVETATGLMQYNKTRNLEAFQSHDACINHLAFTPDGRNLLSTDTEGGIRRWEISTGRNTLIQFPRLQKLQKRPKHALKVKRRFALSHCGEYLFLPKTDTIMVVSTHTGVHVKTLTGHLRSVKCITSSQENEDVYSGGADRSILVWSPSAASDTPRATVPAAALSPRSLGRRIGRVRNRIRRAQRSQGFGGIDSSSEEGSEADEDAVWEDD